MECRSGRSVQVVRCGAVARPDIQAIRPYRAGRAGPRRCARMAVTRVLHPQPSRRRPASRRSVRPQQRQALSNGLELHQQLGGTSVTSRLTFPHDGVMRYEVIGLGRPQTGRDRTRDRRHPQRARLWLRRAVHYFDQANRVVRTLTFDDPGVKTDHAYKVAPWYVSTRGYGLHLDSVGRKHVRHAGGHRSRRHHQLVPIPRLSNWSMDRA